jgi:glycosyltransferase involved in cell wall biosynthesis
MTHALFISRTWPENPDKATHGVFQRLSLFLDALCDSFNHVEMLIFAPHSDRLQENAHRFESRLQERHGRGIRINVQTRRPSPNPWPFASRYIAPIASIDRQERYINIAGAEHVAAVEQALAREPAMVFAHRLHAFTPLWPSLTRLTVPLFFDVDDIEHRALARTIIAQPQWPSERLRLLHLPAILLRERAALRRSTASFVCSEGDAKVLRRLASIDSVHVIPNTVTVPEQIRPRDPMSQSIGFIGSFTHLPNVDAVRRLLGAIWPQVHANNPVASLRIAGSGSRKIFGDFHGKQGVEILDFVEDVATFYQSLDAVVAPLRFGAGTRVKIIEAAGYGLPIISTALGAEGLIFASGTEILLAESDQEFVRQCLTILAQRETAARIGMAARAAFKMHYDRDAVVNKIKCHIAPGVSQRSHIGTS